MKVLAPLSLKPTTELSQLELWRLPPFETGDALIMEFSQALSRAIMRDKQCQSFSELVALGFWLREKNMASLLEHVCTQSQKALGNVVHFTPANVDAMFVYSWICSLLMGNNNLVRVSSRGGEEQSKLLDVINRVLSQPEFTALSTRNVFVQLDYADTSVQPQLEFVCLHADARVIWGGDASIHAVRNYPCTPRCRDICFSDRFSASVINAAMVNDQTQAELAFAKLRKDMQPFQQQACSSPRILYWLGDSKSLRQFFARINDNAGAESAQSQRNEQLFTEQALRLIASVKQVFHRAGLCVVECEQINEEMLHVHSGHQTLLCQCINRVEDLSDTISPRLQTLSYFGLDKPALVKFIQQPSIKGIDRIVPLGEALVFSTHWDGYDLLNQLSRRVVVL